MQTADYHQFINRKLSYLERGCTLGTGYGASWQPLP
jgi:hypothetical protein